LSSLARVRSTPRSPPSALRSTYDPQGSAWQKPWA
jgi:hypothetical protein